MCFYRFYRPPGSTNLIRVTGQRSDGCVPCPKGRYGNSAGLVTSGCTAPCPAGRYNDQLGADSVNSCQFCPLGRYGMVAGLASAKCTAKCPSGYYGSSVGLVQSTDCSKCLPGMKTGQCQWALQPRWGIDSDHQHKEVFGLKPGFTDPLKQGSV